MNNVHEPSPNGDSEMVLSRKLGKKTELGVRAPSWPNWHAQVRTGAPRRGNGGAHGRCIVAGSPAVSWQGAGRVAGPSGLVVGARSRASAVSQAQCRAPTCCVVALQRAVSQYNPNWPASFRSRYTTVYRDTLP